MCAWPVYVLLVHLICAGLEREESELKYVLYPAQMCTDELFQHPGPNYCYCTSSSFILLEQAENTLILGSSA